jgi:thiol-disulfide isomerase/thioredoxin
MKKNLLLVLSLFLLFSCKKSTIDENTFIITLNLTGFEDSTRFDLVNLDEGFTLDSAYLIAGKLTFVGNVLEPISARIHTVDNKYLICWIEKGQISISGTYDDFSNAMFSGSPLNEVMSKYRDQQRRLIVDRDSLMRFSIDLMAKNQGEATDEFLELIQQMDEIDHKLIRQRIEAIKKEIPSYYTVQELYFLRKELAKDSLGLLFNKFPESLKNSRYGNVIEALLNNPSIAVGDSYVDIEGLNLEGQKIRLSDLHGKYILLDFWASWCGPCRKENPNLVNIYKKYKAKGFEIYSFSIDTNLESWKKAVKIDSLTWTNVIDQAGSFSKMTAKYEVQAIPSSFLINPKGIIIAKDLRGSALMEKLEEEFNKP